MPGNKGEDRIFNFYELDNSSPAQNQSQTFGGNYPAINYNQWARKGGRIGLPLSLNLKSNKVQQIDSVKRHVGEYLQVPFGQNYAEFTLRPEFPESFSRNQLLGANGFMLGHQNFQTRQTQAEFLEDNTDFDQQSLTLSGLSVVESQQGNASVDSPTLTTNSERSKIVEVLLDFNVLGGQQQHHQHQHQQLDSGEQQSTPQTFPMQQSGFNDVPLLQQHMMFKQLQELQRQQQLQQLGDARQPNSLNQFSAISKQASGGQFPPLINGTPVRDASQMFMNWVQRGASPALQGVPNRLALSEDHGQALHSIGGLVPQQLDVSLYGTPIASSRGNTSQYSHLPGISHDCSNLLTKVSGNQAQKSIVQSSTYTNHLLGDHSTVCVDQVSMPQGAFIPKQGSQGKNVFGQVPVQGLNSGAMVGNHQHRNILQTNQSMHKFDGREERTGWPGISQQKTTQLAPSQDLVPLDPLEEKILYNMDDMGGAGGFGNALENTDYSAALSNIQSGSWSALMQSAVAEASSSDTGQQEEWSGLAFQNTELSTDNQPSKFMDSEKQQSCWIDNNLQRVSSISSKTFPLFNGPSVSSSYLGFQQSDIQYSNEQSEALHQNDSHRSISKFSKNSGEWLDCSPQQKTSIERSQLVPPLVQLENSRTGRNYDHRESDERHLRIGSCNNVSQPCNEQKGDINEAMYKRRDPGGFMWKSDCNNGVSSFSRSTGGIEQLSSGPDNTLPNKGDSQMNNFASEFNSGTTKAHQETSQQVPDCNQPDYMKHVDFSMSNMEIEKMRKNQNRIGCSTHVSHSSYEGAGETYDRQQNCYPRENSSDSYNSKQLGGREKSQVEQFKFIGNVSTSAMNLEKGYLTDLQRYSKESEEEPSRNDLGSGISATYDGSGDFSGPNVIAQTSENMLELLHKVDQSRVDSTMTHLGPTDYHSLSEVPEAENPVASVGQLYSQSSASHGFGLRLAPPSQRLPNSNHFTSSQGSPQAVSTLNSRQVNSEMGEKSQTWLGSPSSVRFLPPSHESSQRAQWDGKSSPSGNAGIPSYLDIQGNSVGAFTSTPPDVRNQLQTQFVSNAPISCQSSQAPLAGSASRYQPFNLSPSQDTAQHTSTNPFGQQFPILEAAPVPLLFSTSGVSRQGESSLRPHDVWENLQTQRHSSGGELHNVPSADPSKSSVETTLWVPPGLKERNSDKGAYGSAELGACSANSQGFHYGEEQMSSDIIDASCVGVSRGQESMAKNIPDASAFASGSSAACSHPQDHARGHHGDNNVPAVSKKKFEFFGHSLEPHVSRQNYSLLHQAQAMKNVEIDPSKLILKGYSGADIVPDVEQVTSIVGQQSIDGQNLRFRNAMDSGLNSASQFISFPSGNTKTQGFSTEGREDLSVKASSQPAVQSIQSQEMGTYSQSNLQSRSNSGNAVSNRIEHLQGNLPLTPSWFKQYETLRNGQVRPMYDARLAKTAAEQFSLGKATQNLYMNTSIEQVKAAHASQSGVWPGPAAKFVASENFSAPYVLPTGVSDQSLAIVKSKKRKSVTSELLPWHKEVTQGSQRLQNISVAEQDWVQATNRLIEKVGNYVELIVDGKPMIRSKRRLVLTTQLMQQLLRPTPASLFLADATSHSDSMTYFVAKLALGDACTLTCCTRNDIFVATDNNSMISENLKAFERTGDQFLLKFVEDLTDRAKKLENGLLRLDKIASMLDIRVECQELERFSVINRFAKFHIRGQADSSGTAMTAQKPIPQRYVTAIPMPKNLPEGVQCLSL